MKKYKYGISITTYNRPEYLSQFLETFRDTNFLEETVVRILDDDSSNKETLEMLNNFKIDNPNVELHIEHNLYNMGPVYNYTKNIIKFENDDVDYIINLDSDSIHNPEWLNKINEINNHFGPKVLSSVFWCDHGYPYEKIELEETLSRNLGTKVEIKPRGRKGSKGKIVIDYFSLDDFDRIRERIQQ